jgi:membrane protein DedA with SNARE-associated domain
MGMRNLLPRRRVRAVDAVCVGGLLLSIVYPLALSPLEPWLLGVHPLIVATFVGTIESLVTAGAFARVGRGMLWLAILAPIFGSDLLDPFSWWAGRRYGPSLLTSTRFGQRWRDTAVRSEATFRRWGPWAMVLAYYLPVPNVLIYMAAGETGMSLPVFLLLDWAGTALSVLPLVLLGFALGQPAVSLAQLITKYAGVSALVLLALIVAYNLWRNRRQLASGRRPGATILP